MTQLSYTHGTAPTPLIGSSLGRAFRETAEAFPGADALVSPAEGFRATYSELLELVTRVSRGLLARGVRRGDRLGLWSANRYEWIVVQLSAAQIGAVLVPINPAFKTSELEFSVNKVQISTLIMSPNFRDTDYLEIISAVRPSTPSLTEVIVFGADWDRLLDDADEVPETELLAREAQVQPDDPAYVMYTSGTTGEPKGTTLSHQGQLNNGYLIGEGLSYTHLDRICLPVPLFHGFGCTMGVLAAITHGSAMVLCGEAFVPDAVLATVSEERCTSLYGVPTMFIAELASPNFTRYDLGSLRTGIMAGAPCPVEVMKKVHALMNMREVVVMYGMTETGITTRTSPGDPFDKQIGSVGQAMPFTEIKIVDPTGALVTKGEAGELCARGVSTMLGYWDDDEATRSVVDNARWMHTGDLATLDADGYLKIVGRIKDMIIRGGENVFPSEVEGFLYKHDKVEDVQVIGVPSERYGEEVMAFVRPRNGCTITDEEMAAYCQGAIATYKIPKYWKFVTEYPMTPSGKVQKYKLRRTAISELGLDSIGQVETA